MHTFRGLNGEAGGHDTTPNTSENGDGAPYLSSRVELGARAVLENVGPQEVVVNHGAQPEAALALYVLRRSVSLRRVRNGRQVKRTRESERGTQ